MPEITIKYKNKKTLDALIDFSKYFDFSVVLPNKKTVEKISNINGVTIISANKSIDISEIENIFTGKNIIAKEIRKAAWQRKK
ncbi:MAG: hypothetical protein ACOYMA_16130 [Bacteroidia bacterium]|jgi:hypothetical protein